MANTTNYGFEKYDPGDSPDLQGKFNRDMDAIDAAIKNNAGVALPTVLQHLVDKTKSTTHGSLTVADLSNISVTDEGLLFIKNK